MRKHILLLIFIASACLLFSQSKEKVLIIGVDGCRPDALSVAHTPNIDTLIANGLFSPDALIEDHTISGPGWSAILCGVWSDKHLVTNNNFNGNNYDEFPSFFKYINDFDSDLHTVSICHWSPINDFIIQDDVDFKLNVDSDLEVAIQLSSYLQVNDPDVVFIHFDEVDIAGHSYGFSPDVPSYVSTIESIDEHIGAILETIKSRADYNNEDWLILVTTDHGGVGFSHGGTSIEHRNVFVIASGNNINHKLISKDSSIISDSIFNCLADSLELFFDGTSNVRIPPGELWNFGLDQDFTIECRVRTNESGDVSIIGNKDWNSGSNKGFVFSFKFLQGPNGR